MMRTASVVALLVALAAGLVLGGCGGDSVVIPNEYQGTWMAATLDSDGDLVGVGMFSVAANGTISSESEGIIASGTVWTDGSLLAHGTSENATYRATGALSNDDTGTGDWTRYNGSTANGTGTFLFWRANGGAYAGTWDVVVSGGASGTGAVVVDANGVGSGTATVNGVEVAVQGVVTGSGTVVVAWSISDIWVLGDGPANGTASGSEATGTWTSSNSGTGTWTATKQ